MIPHPTAPSFDLDNALALVRLAALAYPERGESERAYRDRLDHCAHRIVHPEILLRHFAARDTDTQGFVAATPDAIVVAFRGSREPLDFLTDVKFRKVESELIGGRVHRGFLRAFESVEVEVIHLVQSLRRRLDQPLFLTGHSLGAALATLAAPALARIHEALPFVYTFGSPRVGDGAFAEQFDELLGPRAFRFVNNEDPVPRLPAFWHNYWHVGHEAFFTRGELIIDPSLGCKLVSDARGIWSDYRRGRLALLPDHFIRHYVTRLETLTRPERGHSCPPPAPSLEADRNVRAPI